MIENKYLKTDLEIALMDSEVDFELGVSVSDIADHLIEELKRLRTARQIVMDGIRTSEVLKENGINDTYQDHEGVY